MMFVGDDSDDPFRYLTVSGFHQSEEYTGNGGYVVMLHVPDADTLRAVLDRWGLT